jgi:hypothetical protein
MPEIKFALDLQVSGGPQFPLARTLPVEAYDFLRVKVEKDAKDREVEVQPGGSGQVKFLLINASVFGETPLTYRLEKSDDDPPPPAATPVSLDMPLLLMGKGALKLLAKAPTKLYFSNISAEDVYVEILVGRAAVPPPP